jgi:hypothetical protein
MRVGGHIVAFLCIWLLLLSGCGKNELDIGGQGVSVPTPVGFNPLRGQVPTFRAFVEKSYLPKFILIEFYLTDSDFSDVVAGHSKFRNRSLSVAVPREFFRRDFSEGAFQDVALEVHNAEGGQVESVRSAQNIKNEDDSLKFGHVPSHVDTSQWLGVFFEQRDAIGTATLQTVRVGNVVTKHIGASVSMRVRSRYISIGCTANVRDDADIEWAKQTCSRWAQSILVANSSYNGTEVIK